MIRGLGTSGYWLAAPVGALSRSSLRSFGAPPAPPVLAAASLSPGAARRRGAAAAVVCRRPRLQVCALRGSGSSVVPCRLSRRPSGSGAPAGVLAARPASLCACALGCVGLGGVACSGGSPSITMQLHQPYHYVPHCMCNTVVIGAQRAQDNAALTLLYSTYVRQ